jgi:hypothetical protein
MLGTVSKNTFCLTDSIALINRYFFWTILFRNYWILPRWIFDEIFSSFMMVSWTISVTLLEIILRLPILGVG